MIVATAGHVDHGKTTLIRALTGVETDRLPEEQARGMTIDLGFAYLEVPDSSDVIGFVDVPGHERFVRNMLAGVAGIDFALLVIAADDGPMPQTREHLAILELLGITRGAVALTKIDRVDADRVHEVVAEVVALLAATPLAGSPVIPVAASEGRGVEALRETLLFAQAGRTRGIEEARGHFRLAIDRRFILDGAGRVVTGTVYSGRVAPGDELCIAPANLDVRVRSLHAQNRASLQATAGQRCGVNVSGGDLRRHEIHRGDWLVASALASTTTRLGVLLRLARDEAQALKDGTPVHVHLGASDLGGRVALLEGATLAPGETMFAQLQLDAPALAVQGDRFVLRDQSARRTLAGGEVLEAVLWPGKLSRARRLELLQALAVEDPMARLAALTETQPEGVSPEWFARNINLLPGDLARLTAHPEIRELGLMRDGARLLSAARLEALRAAILRTVRAHHAAEPDQTGLPEPLLGRTLAAREPPELLRAVTEQLVREGIIARRAGQLCDPAHTPVLPPAEERLLARVAAELKRHGRQAPALHDMPESLQLTIEVLKPFMERMAKLGHLHQVGRYRYYLPETLKELAHCAETLSESSDGACFTAVQYKEYCGIGRNVTIELLEYFDRVGLTRRQGQTRRMRQRVAQVLGG